MIVERLWSILKKVGPTVMAGYIGAAAVQDLMAYRATHKRRHMNAGNTRALRRSMRRLRSFDKLAHRVSAQLHRGGTRRRSAARCTSCRKSPCSC